MREIIKFVPESKGDSYLTGKFKVTATPHSLKVVGKNVKVNLYRNKELKTFSIKNLLLTSLIIGIENNANLIYLNGDFNDVRLSNLAWATKSETLDEFIRGA